MKLSYKKMLKDIDKLVNNDFGQDMELKLIPHSEAFMQEEARQMSEIIARVYLISHCVFCKWCQGKYKLNQK